jgi:hypothetical protein
VSALVVVAAEHHRHFSSIAHLLIGPSLAIGGVLMAPLSPAIFAASEVLALGLDQVKVTVRL